MHNLVISLSFFSYWTYPLDHWMAEHCIPNIQYSFERTLRYPLTVEQIRDCVSAWSTDGGNRMLVVSMESGHSEYGSQRQFASIQQLLQCISDMNGTCTKRHKLPNHVLLLRLYHQPRLSRRGCSEQSEDQSYSGEYSATLPYIYTKDDFLSTLTPIIEKHLISIVLFVFTDDSKRSWNCYGPLARLSTPLFGYMEMLKRGETAIYSLSVHTRETPSQ